MIFRQSANNVRSWDTQNKQNNKIRESRRKRERRKHTTDKVNVQKVNSLSIDFFFILFQTQSNVEFTIRNPIKERESGWAFYDKFTRNTLFCSQRHYFEILGHAFHLSASVHSEFRENSLNSRSTLWENLKLNFQRINLDLYPRLWERFSNRDFKIFPMK